MAFLDYNGLTHYNDNLNEKFNAKANVDGAYEGMTVGNAEQLISSVYTEDSVPYLFRTSGGSADIGDREFDEIVGGTVAWNQQIYDGNFADATSWERLTGATVSISNNECVATITGNFGGVRTKASLSADYRPLIISGHKYFISAQIKASAQRTNSVGLGLSDSNSHYPIRKVFSVGTSYSDYAFIGTQTDGNPDQSVSCIMVYDTKGSEGVTLYVKNIIAVDLTLMFGSTIADYIYSLEQSTSGSGVAFFRKLFPKPYYAYNSGELISSLPTAHETVGFNALNTENAINATNVVSANDNGTISVKDVSTLVWSNSYLGYVDLVAGQVYAVEGVLIYGRLGLSINNHYPQNDNIPEGTIMTVGASFASMLTKNRAYGKFVVNNTMRVYLWYCSDADNSSHQTFTFSPCIHLVWDGERDGEYEPYVKHTYPISEVAMHGIWKLDANNKIYCDGDIRKADGTLERRYGIVDLGSLTWVNNGAITGGVQYACTTLNKANGETNFVCPAYATHSPIADIGYICGRASTPTISINSSITDLSDFVASLSGVYLVYELATPTAETVDTFASPQIVDDFGTEEYVDTRAVPIPVGHNTKYTQNLRAKVEMSPDSPSDNGDYLVRHNNGENEYVPFIDRIPSAPSDNGTYVLKCTVNGSTISYTWVAE